MEGFTTAGAKGVSPKVMVVYDDASSSSMWAFAMRQKGMEVAMAAGAEEALDHWAEEIPDLILIDASTPQMDAVSLIGALRAETVIPILYLAPTPNEAAILEAYQAGADDCIPKPVSPALLLAKVRAWLRRAWNVPAESLETMQAGGLTLDPARRMATTVEGRAARLTNLEFRVLRLLMSNPGWVFSNEEIVQRVWGYHGNGDSKVLKNVIYRLRRKLEEDHDNPRYIQTEGTAGYKFTSTRPDTDS